MGTSQPVLDGSLLDELEEPVGTGPMVPTPIAPGPPEKKKQHVCPVCLKVFVSTKGLGQHQIIHTDKKPFVCGSCGKAFRFKSNLFEHRSVHTGVHPFTCQVGDPSIEISLVAKIYSFKQCGKSCRLKGNLKKHLKTHVKDGDIDEQSAAAWTANLSSPDISEMLDGSASAANISGEKKLIAPADPNSTPKQKRKSRPPAQKKEKVKSPKKSPFDYDQGQPAQAYIIVPASNTYGANPLSQEILDPFGFAPPVNFDQQQPLIFPSQTPQENFLPKMKLEGVKQEGTVPPMENRVIVQPVPVKSFDERLIRVTNPKQRKFLIELSQTAPLSAFFEKARHIPFEEYSCHVCQMEMPTRSALRHHLESQHRSDYSQICSVCLKVFKTTGEMERHQYFHQRIKSMFKSKALKDSGFGTGVPKIRQF